MISSNVQFVIILEEQRPFGRIQRRRALARRYDLLTFRSLDDTTAAVNCLALFIYNG